MKTSLSFLVLIFTLSSADENIGGLFGVLGKGIQQGIHSVSQPIEKGFNSLGSNPFQYQDKTSTSRNDHGKSVIDNFGTNNENDKNNTNKTSSESSGIFGVVGKTVHGITGIVQPPENKNINQDKTQSENKNGIEANSTNMNITSDSNNGFLDTASKSIQKEVSSIKQTVEEGIVTVGSSQCTTVKKILGLDYEQIAGEKEPDIKELALEFRDKTIRIVFSLASAAAQIVQALRNGPGERLTLYVHGFTDAPSNSGFSNISEALFHVGEFNVLALDGSSLLKWWYLRSTTYVRFMGARLGETLAAMHKVGMDSSKIHIIGHSLGAHISGFAGKTFADLTGRKVGRITALDPAGPCFSHIEPELRLKASDATFVDVIHTDAAVLGLEDAVGHADFYPNNGKEQPDCFLQTCSHSRAWLLYSESVRNHFAFPARRCQDWEAFKKGDCDGTAYMGYACDPSARGKFYLQTRGESAYGLGQEGLVYHDNEAIVKKVGSGLLSIIK